MMRPPHFCAAPGCNAIISTGNRCALHQTVQRREEDGRKDPKIRALYNNARWRAYSRNRIAAHPLCVRCGGLASVTDHINPHRGDYGLFWDPENHQSLCIHDHNKKTSTEDRALLP